MPPEAANILEYADPSAESSNKLKLDFDGSVLKAILPAQSSLQYPVDLAGWCLLIACSVALMSPAINLALHLWDLATLPPALNWTVFATGLTLFGYGSAGAAARYRRNRKFGNRSTVIFVTAEEVSVEKLGFWALKRRTYPNSRFISIRLWPTPTFPAGPSNYNLLLKTGKYLGPVYLSLLNTDGELAACVAKKIHQLMPHARLDLKLRSKP